MLLAAYCRAEGRKRQSGDFEKLLAKGDSHNGYAPQNAVHGGGYSDFPTENQHPEHIQQHAARSGSGVIKFLAEGRCGELRHFEALLARRNPDYCYAKQQPGDASLKPQQKTAEQEPEYIPECFH